MSNKKHNYVTCVIFCLLLVWCVISCVQILSPLMRQITADKQLFAVTINDELKKTLTQNIDINSSCFWSMLMLHLGCMLFLCYSILVRIFYIIGKNLHKKVMPILSGICTVLILLAFIIDASCNSYNFFIFAIPMVFLGILPFITGLKTVVKKS